MLTRDLLRHTSRQGEIQPQLVSPTNRPLLQLAEQLIALYANAQGQTQAELGELAAPLLASYRGPIIAKGLNKLLLDRCRFREGADDLPEQRQAAFRAAALHLTDPALNDLTLYRQTVGRALGVEADLLSQQLYADLPERQPLERFRPITATGLLHRYNIAQAQGLLLHCAALSLWLREERLPRLRQFLRYLRFFQLLALIEPLADGKGYHVQVDGPLSLLLQTQKYGLQLANLLPVVAGLAHWRLEAEVRLPHQQPARLLLDQDSGLVTHFTQLSGYQPEEFQVFARQFQEENPAWLIQPEPALFPVGARELVAPDFTFLHRESGAVAHLELFHPWHAAALQRRLAHLDQTDRPPPLLIGADRALRKLVPVAATLDQSRWFQNFGIAYAGFPSVKRVAKALDALLHTPLSGATPPR